MPFVPVLKVEIDFANGPSFSYPLILDDAVYGILGSTTINRTLQITITIEQSPQRPSYISRKKG